MADEARRGDRGSMRGLLGTNATNVATAALGVVSSVLAARLLGPGGRGELAAILNWPSILTAFGSLGLMPAAAYYCGREPSEAGRTIGSAWVALSVLSLPIMAAAVELLRPYPHLELLWASPRELLNIFQAEAVGCHIITVTHDLLRKLSLVGKDLHDYSVETVKMFYEDGQKAGYRL